MMKLSKGNPIGKEADTMKKIKKVGSFLKEYYKSFSVDYKK